MRVWLQRAHCFRRVGATGTAGQGMTEQEYSNAVCTRARGLLVARGHVVHLGLADERIRGHWTFFGAPHCDGAASRTASGASVGYRTADGKRAARLWKARWRERGWPYGFRDDNYTAALSGYYGTGWAAAADVRYGFVLEHGFMTNPTRDGPWLVRNIDLAALALADTVSMLDGGDPLEDGGESGPPPYPSRPLRRGLRDDPDVVIIQRRLTRLGVVRLAADGDFGPLTEAAVRDFQRDRGLPVDGVVGRATWTALWS